MQIIKNLKELFIVDMSLKLSDIPNKIYILFMKPGGNFNNDEKVKKYGLVIQYELLEDVKLKIQKFYEQECNLTEIELKEKLNNYENL